MDEKEEYEIKYTNKFERRFRELDSVVRRRIFDKIKLLRENPFMGKALLGDLRGIYSLRVGDYRVLYTIRDKVVFLLTVGHRRSIYRRS